MSNLDELIQKARLLRSEGHSPGQIADELSLSMETVTWLLTQEKGAATPKDIHIDWTTVSGESQLLKESAQMLLSRLHLKNEGIVPEIFVGIAISGIPLATLMAVSDSARLGIYHPAKHAGGEEPIGSMSGNFGIRPGEKIVIVDDVITSGKTLQEVISYIKRHGAVPVACSVLFDKRGIREIDGVPVYSLFKVSRID
ncbi:MAG TPA: orotate phosphoribosyltransferase-like protein [Methanospirillum sp.]|uniref:orotate phosphoribosyltransferase-like protein n=1 Tax=Methanospirillum sp. TaxID=45200 RepID=UPI002CD6B046|nr:orotate phosphoribosyltransferase-like protein [Methanospirillum sp.]HPY61004.1 orotate phosphoribosyltransferase-like protein [Methanospirillum sp.]